MKEKEGEDKEKAKENLKKQKKELEEMEKERIENARKAAEAKYMNEGETSSRYWFSLNKERKLANVIYTLQDKEGKITKSTNQWPGDRITSVYDVVCICCSRSHIGYHDHLRTNRMGHSKYCRKI